MSLKKVEELLQWYREIGFTVIVNEDETAAFHPDGKCVHWSCYTDENALWAMVNSMSATAFRVVNGVAYRL